MTIMTAIVSPVALAKARRKAVTIANFVSLKTTFLIKYSFVTPRASESFSNFSLTASIFSIQLPTKKGIIIIDKIRLPAKTDSPVDRENEFSRSFSMTIIPKKPYTMDGIPERIFTVHIITLFIAFLE